MKKITTILAALLLTFSFSSCNDESLQGYLVESQEKSGFITFDVPASILQIKSDDVSDDVRETLNSIKKINVVALPFKDNAADVEAEKAELQKILKGSSYKSLMRFTHENMKVNLYYSGEADAIDEVIAFGYAENMGVGIARIIGENMNPSKIVQMMNDIKLDSNGVQGLTGLFK